MPTGWPNAPVKEKEAPAALGSPSFPALEAAPGTYVFDR